MYKVADLIPPETPLEEPPRPDLEPREEPSPPRWWTVADRPDLPPGREVAGGRLRVCLQFQHLEEGPRELRRRTYTREWFDRAGLDPVALPPVPRT